MKGELTINPVIRCSVGLSSAHQIDDKWPSCGVKQMAFLSDREMFAAGQIS